MSEFDILFTQPKQYSYQILIFMHFVKIRIMHFSGSNEASLIPFVLFHEVNFEQLDSLYEVINTEINSKKINSGSQEQIAENRLKIVQYMYSDFWQ